MYKSNLPKNCPPSDVEENDIVLYRLIVLGDMVKSFENYVEIYPENLDFIDNCKAYGLSFFNNIEKVKSLLMKDNNQNKMIAKVTIKKKFGVINKKPGKCGHYSLWLFENFNPDEVVYELVN